MQSNIRVQLSLTHVYMQEKTDIAVKRAEELQMQFTDLHEDYENLRKSEMLQLQRKVFVQHIVVGIIIYNAWIDIKRERHGAVML